MGIGAKSTASVAPVAGPETRQACTVSVVARPTKPSATSTALKPAEAPTVRPPASKTARSQSPEAALSRADTIPLIGAAT